MYYILVFVIGLFIGSKLSNVNIGWNNTIENDLKAKPKSKSKFRQRLDDAMKEQKRKQD